MRLALTLYADNGSTEITSIDCNFFYFGCMWMRNALNMAIERSTSSSPETTVVAGDGTPVGDILAAFERLRDLEDTLPTVSCEDSEKQREQERQNPYKKCPTCGGSGKVKKD
jgi:hypothetical protein